MNKLHKLELRKLLKELDYINSELEYKNELVFEADNSFMVSLHNLLDKNPVLKEMFDKKVNRRIDEFVKEKSNINLDEPIDNKELVVRKVVDEKVKKLYRDIVKKTHPYKITDSNLNDIYISASKMYDENDIIGIYSVCDKLGIYYDISIEDSDSLKSQILKTKERISFMESTFTWKWFNTEDELERSKILLEYIKSKII